MSSFQEWSEQLSRKAPIVIPLHRIAVAPDNSLGKLEQLLAAGYDRVEWVNAEQFGSTPCPLCQQIANEINSRGGISLAAFLGREEVELTKDDGEGNAVPVPPEEDNRSVDEKYPKVVDIYRDAPVYNWAHVGCKCGIKVYKSTDQGAVELVFASGGSSPTGI